jgi:hypothetical protein
LNLSSKPRHLSMFLFPLMVLLLPSMALLLPLNQPLFLLSHRNLPQGQTDMDIVASIEQLHQKGVFEPTSVVRPGHRVIPCSYFVKEKFNGDEKLMKLKGRCVADGHKQIRSASTSTSSPTVVLTSVFVVITIAAHNRWDVVTVDITGAY